MQKNAICAPQIMKSIFIFIQGNFVELKKKKKIINETMRYEIDVIPVLF